MTLSAPKDIIEDASGFTGQVIVFSGVDVLKLALRVQNGGVGTIIEGNAPVTPFIDLTPVDERDNIRWEYKDWALYWELWTWFRQHYQSDTYDGGGAGVTSTIVSSSPSGSSTFSPEALYTQQLTLCSQLQDAINSTGEAPENTNNSDVEFCSLSSSGAINFQTGVQLIPYIGTTLITDLNNLVTEFGNTEQIRDIIATCATAFAIQVQMGQPVNFATFTNAANIAARLGLNTAQTEWLIQNQARTLEIKTFLNTHNQTANKANTAKVVALAYLQLRMSTDADVQTMMSDIANQTISSNDPLWDIVIEQIGAIAQELLVDIIPGGTLVTVGPQALQQFEQGDWMGGMWTTLEIVLDETSRFIPPAKVINLGISLADKAYKLSKFYDVMKKVYTLGDDVAYKVYQVFRNRLGSLYSKVEWVSNAVGVQVSGADPFEIWDDIENIFPNATILTPAELATYEIAGIRLTNQTKITMKYGGNTNPNGYSLEFKTNQGFILKFRF